MSGQIGQGIAHMAAKSRKNRKASEAPGNGSGNCGELVREIKKIYRQHGYRRKGRPLEKFGQPELEAHLAMLQAGKYPWITRSFGNNQ